MRSNLNTENQRTGIDASTILSSIHTYDPQTGCTNSTFQPYSSRALANHKTVTDSFRNMYSINSGIAKGHGVAVGRYPEDSDHGGNPWYVTTLAAAEQLYLARLQWQDQEQLTIDETSLPFFRDLLPRISIGTYRSRPNSATFKSVLSAVQDYADGYMAMVKKYTPSDGDLSEQFSRNNGAPVSTSDSAWSNMAFQTAVDRRNGIRGDSWGEPENNVVEISQCYCHVTVTFNLRSRYTALDYAWIVGDVPELGNGNVHLGRGLDAESPYMELPFNTKYTNHAMQIDVPASTFIKYHYFLIDKLVYDPNPRGESVHHYVHTGECGSNTIVHDGYGNSGPM